MSLTQITAVAPPIAAPGSLRLFWRSFSENRGAVIGLGVMVTLVLLAAFADVIAQHSPIEQYRTHFLTPPIWQPGGDAAFPLGTDDVGRDMLSRLIYGARLSLIIGTSVASLALLTGTALGLTAAFVGGVIDIAIMRLMDILLVFPSLLLAIVIVAILGPGLFNAMLAVAVVTLPGYTRLSRASALSELARDYVAATRCAAVGGTAAADVLDRAAELHGAADRAVCLRAFTRDRYPRYAAALGYLGLGAQPPTPEWGTMLCPARCNSTSAPGGCWHSPASRSSSPCSRSTCSATGCVMRSTRAETLTGTARDPQPRG